MDCCSAEKTAEGICPTCGGRGRKVGTVTLTALVPDRTLSGEDWKFCRTQDCPVAYYSGSNEVVPVADVAVPITQKSTAPDRPVCYCFLHSAEDIENDHAAAIAADIKARCGRGEDRCHLTNPQGSCCLGNVVALTSR
jgi:hypothetical protein